VKMREIFINSLAKECWDARGKAYYWWCMQEFNFKQKLLWEEGYMSGSKNIEHRRDSYMPCVAMAHSTKSGILE
jgi:hypothetical protein